MIASVAVLFVAGMAAPWLISRLGRNAFVILALFPLLIAGWLVAQAPQVLGGQTLVESVSWVPSISLDIDLRLNTVAWVMSMLITVIGAVVLAYSARYFDSATEGLGRYAGLMVAFAAAMLGLVMSDNLLLMFIFWEFTSVFSYLLIGQNPEKGVNRRSAMKALIVTTFGGLVMLVGILIIGQFADTYSLTAIVANPPTGTLISVAVVLVLVGALSKSAIFPFHFWLPGAMAAPTPVSAYLHAAAMVKAGVYLIAVLAPAFADLLGWRETVLILGLATMLIGSIGALRQTDLKLLLAYGTVSQLGLIVTVLGLGTQAAALAGMGLVIAHALFKSALFLSVGVVDRAAGTRDLTIVSGVGRQFPVLAIGMVFAALSMAAIIPATGFVAKEAAVQAFIDYANTSGAVWAWLVVATIGLGAVLTVAYTARFVWGALATKDTSEAAKPLKHQPMSFQLPTIVLGTAGIAVGLLAAGEQSLLSGYVAEFAPGFGTPKLAVLPHLGLALGISVASWIVGLLVWRSLPWARIRDDGQVATVSAEHAYHRAMYWLDRSAVEVTGAYQRGSLPTYMSYILLLVVLLPGPALIYTRTWPEGNRWFDSPAQLVTVIIIAAAAMMAIRARRRLKAVVLVGVTGYGMVVLFALFGAPDLALTQALVETVTLVLFVLVLRRMPPYFSDRPLQRTRYLRMALGAGVGVAVALFAMVAVGARDTVPISTQFAQAAYDTGDGKNVVNVTLVDIRAWDTLGEISVIVVAATGIASLIFVRRRSSRIVRSRDIASGEAVWSAGAPGGLAVRQQVFDRVSRANTDDLTVWLAAGRTLAPERRNLILEVVTRLMFPTMIVLSVYVLFAGHNHPGGGFAAGLIAGGALIVRYLAAGPYELAEAVPFDAGRILGVGLAIAVLTGIAAIPFGGAVFQSVAIEATIPLLGQVKLVTSLFFDIGVYLIVLGLFVDVLRTLGAEIDYQADEEWRADHPERVRTAAASLAHTATAREAARVRRLRRRSQWSGPGDGDRGDES